MTNRIIDDIDGYVAMSVEEDEDPLALAFITCQAFQEFAAELALSASAGAEFGSIINKALRASSSLFKGYWNLRYRKGQNHDKDTIKESTF